MVHPFRYGMSPHVAVPLPKPFAAVRSRRRFPPPDLTPQRLQASSLRREDDRPKGTRPSSVLARRRWVSTDPCYAAAMIHDLITAIMVTSAAVLASELLVRIWDYF